jgi:hypothetical protein
MIAAIFILAILLVLFTGQATVEQAKAIIQKSFNLA